MEKKPRKIKCELYNDSMQGWKCYPIQKAQLIIADVPYNVVDNAKNYRDMTIQTTFHFDEIPTIRYDITEVIIPEEKRANDE